MPIDYNDVRTHVDPCKRCGGLVTIYTWDSSDGAYTDYKLDCGTCGWFQWIESGDY